LFEIISHVFDGVLLVRQALRPSVTAVIDVDELQFVG